MSRYSSIVMDHFQSPRNYGQLSAPDVVGVAGVPGMGKFLVLYLRLEDDRVAAAGFVCHGCGPTIAAGSMLTETIISRTLAECRGVRARDLSAALGGLPADKQSSAELAIQALQDALSSAEVQSPQRRVRIAILSLLFNWPSTGGGTVHTAESAKFLSNAGYEVRHFYARNPEWGLGEVTESLDYARTPLNFNSRTWQADEIVHRFREAVDEFAPDYVLITDSWSFKPLLAEAVRGYRYFLRLAASECLCPLNNVRLLISDEGRVSTCPKHQLATPEACRSCVLQRGKFSGGLHQAERALAGFGTSTYTERLYRAFAEAEGVLVVNPLAAAMVSPYVKQVHVVPSGFDAARFPWPWPEEASPVENCDRRIKQILFAGVVDEPMKGFHILRAAGELLWQQRQDFEVLATGEPRESADPFVRFIGWKPQAELPAALRAADIVVFPTIAEEGIGRSAVEALGVGRPVVASRIGGLQFTIQDEGTGLLFEPGDSKDLSRQLARLLDTPALCRQLGDAGRRQFERAWTWSSVIRRHYFPLFGPPQRTAS